MMAVGCDTSWACWPKHQEVIAPWGLVFNTEQWPLVSRTSSALLGALQASVPIYKARKSSWFRWPSMDAKLYHFHHSQWITSKSLTIQTITGELDAYLLMNSGQGLTEHGGWVGWSGLHLGTTIHCSCVFSFNSLLPGSGYCCPSLQWRNGLRWVKFLACGKAYARQSWSSTQTVRSRHSPAAHNAAYQNRGRGAPMPVLLGAGSEVVKPPSPL